jgi:hypothetical protein
MDNGKMPGYMLFFHKKDYIIQEYEKGKEIVELSNEIGISPTQIRLHLKMLGVKIRHGNFLNRNEKEVEEVIKQRSLKQRDAQLQKKYNMTLDEFNTISAKQNNKCSICGKVTSLCVDHDHISGKVRGLICRFCNSMLGQAKDNQETLRNAIYYLQEFELDNNN